MNQTATLLSCNQEIGTGPDEFGELRDANSLLGDVEALRQRVSEDGYLLVRHLIDPEKVLAARREILLKFAIVGEVDSIHNDVMDGVLAQQTFIDQVNLVAFTESLRSGAAYGDVVEGSEIMTFFDSFLGGPARSFPFRWPRLMRQDESTGVHCDGPYITRGTTNVWTAWIPLGDVPMTDGALMILEGSHRNEEVRQSYGTRDADRDALEWLSTDPPVLRRQLGGRWLSTSFAAGDVLIFGPYLVHASLNNRSSQGRGRLSSDTRYQLATDALDERWNGSSNPHGGAARVFLPGLAAGRNNRDFADEWKYVDQLGRLLPIS